MLSISFPWFILFVVWGFFWPIVVFFHRNVQILLSTRCLLALLECILWRKGLNGILLMFTRSNWLLMLLQNPHTPHIPLIFGASCSTPAVLKSTPRTHVLQWNIQHFVYFRTSFNVRFWLGVGGVGSLGHPGPVLPAAGGVWSVLCLCAASILFEAEIHWMYPPNSPRGRAS